MREMRGKRERRGKRGNHERRGKRERHGIRNRSHWDFRKNNWYAGLKPIMA